MIVPILVIIIIALVMVYMFNMKAKESYNSDYKFFGSSMYGIPGYDSQYTTNQCSGGNYFTSSGNPYLQGCNSTGINNKPLRFEYTPLTNGARDNAQCNQCNVSSLCSL